MQRLPRHVRARSCSPVAGCLARPRRPRWGLALNRMPGDSRFNPPGSTEFRVGRVDPGSRDVVLHSAVTSVAAPSRLAPLVWRSNEVARVES